MANTKTAYRWNADGWYFKSIEVAEDPDFEGEYNLPRQSTWDVPPADTETQWAKINSSTLTWELADLSMADRLLMNLITQEEYDTWFSKKDGEFLSVLKTRAANNADNIALVSDVETEAEYRANADSLINESIASAMSSIKSLQESLTENSNADSENKIALEQAIFALQQTTQALSLAVNNKADAGHSHSVVGKANKLATARKIGNANFDGSADISLTEMGVGTLIASAVANAGSGITVERSGNDTVIRDTKNKIGFFFSLYDAGSGYSSNYGPRLPRDFKRIISAFGAADSGSVRVSVNRSDNDVCLYSTNNFTIASLLVVATLN